MREDIIKKMVVKIIDFHRAKETISEYISESEYNQAIELLLNDLLNEVIIDNETSPNDEIKEQDKVFYEWKTHIQLCGVKDADIFGILKDVAEVIEK